MVYLQAYLLVGFILCATVGLIGRSCRKKDFTPLLMPVMFASGSLGGGALLFLLGLLFWPVWLAVQVIEWSSGTNPPLPPIPPSTASIPRGAFGIAVTDLKPGGKIRVSGSLTDGLSDSGFIAAGEEIEVLDRMLTGVRVRRRIVVADALLDKP